MEKALRYENETFYDEDWSQKQERGLIFDHCIFRGMKLHEWDTASCQFLGCKFIACTFNGSVHTHTTFSNCTFQMCNFFCVEFRGCKMTGSLLEESSHIGMVIQGGNWSYTTMRFFELARNDLSGVNFEGADLTGCQLQKSNLTYANLRQAVLHRANLKEADLRGADLSGVSLSTVQWGNTKIDLEQAVLFARSMGGIVI